MRFYHRKHQCYIVGEGSFIGRYGFLHDISDREKDSMAESIQSSTMSRRRSTIPMTPKKLKVKADMESIDAGADSPRPQLLAPDVGSQEQEQSISFSREGSTSQSVDTKLENRKHSTTVDEVVSEDGK